MKTRSMLRPTIARHHGHEASKNAANVSRNLRERTEEPEKGIRDGLDKHALRSEMDLNDVRSRQLAVLWLVIGGQTDISLDKVPVL